MIRALAAALTLLVGACAVAARVDTLGPDFDGVTIIRMRGNVLPTPASGGSGIELNAEVRRRAATPDRYALLVEVRTEGLRIRGGESLRLVLDGDTVLLRRDSATTSWERLDPMIREQARYPVSDTLLRRLPAVQEGRMAVRGAGWWESRRLSAKNLAALQEFVRAHVPPDTARVVEPPSDSLDTPPPPVR